MTAENGGPRSAAFFDLDKTLMAGSSGVFFARAAYETGMISRRRLVRDVYENLRFRLVGSTDDRADAAVSADARPRLRPPGPGPAGVHPHRRLAGDGGSAGARAGVRRRGGLA